MGNTLNCCPGSSSCIKVYGDKGLLLKFYRPVTASKLMREHPDHLIVYSVNKTRKGNGLGMMSKNHVRIRVCRPGNVLRMGKVYFLVHIPEQYTAKFAKYFNRQRSSTHSSPSSSPLSMCSSAPGSPLSIYDSPAASPRWTASPRSAASLSGSIRETRRPAIQQQPSWNSAPSSRIQSPARLPAASPKRSFYNGTASPLTNYIPSPLSGSIRETRRPANQQQPSWNSAPSSRIQSPARLGTLITSNQDVMRSIVNQHFQRDQIKSMLSPGRLGTPTQDRTNQQFQRYPSRLVQSPGRPGSNSPSTKDTLGNIIQSRLAQGPGRPVLPRARTKETLASIIGENHQQRGSSPCQSNQSPGRSTQDTLRNILKQQQRGSPIQYPQRGGLPFFSKKSPRRSSKGGAGKASRPRRGGSRSPHHIKAVSLRSPVRIVHASVAITKDNNGSLSRMFRESPRRIESNDVAPPQPRAPLQAPPPVLGGQVRRKVIRLLRTRSVHCPGWTPALQSISESSPVEGSAAALMEDSTPGFTSFHVQVMCRTPEIRKPALQKICDIL